MNDSIILIGDDEYLVEMDVLEGVDELACLYREIEQKDSDGKYVEFAQDVVDSIATNGCFNNDDSDLIDDGIAMMTKILSNC